MDSLKPHIQNTRNNKIIIKNPVSRFKSTTPSELSLELLRKIIAARGDSQTKIARKYGFHNQSSLARMMWGHYIPIRKSTRERYAAMFGVDISLFSKLCDELLNLRREQEDNK